MEKALSKTEVLTAGVGWVYWACVRYSCRHFPNWRAGGGFSEAGNTNTIGAKKKKLQTQVTYFYYCYKGQKEGHASTGYGCRSTFADTQMERKEPGKDVGAGEIPHIGSASQWGGLVTSAGIWWGNTTITVYNPGKKTADLLPKPAWSGESTWACHAARNKTINEGKQTLRGRNIPAGTPRLYCKWWWSLVGWTATVERYAGQSGILKVWIQARSCKTSMYLHLLYVGTGITFGWPQHWNQTQTLDVWKIYQPENQIPKLLVFQVFL